MSTRIIAMILASCAVTYAGTFTDNATKLHFPDQIGEWKKTDVIHFPDQKLGVEVNYKSRGAAIASFVVYSAGVSKIPTGAENKVVQAEFAQDVAGSMAYVRQHSKDLSKVLDSTPNINFHGKRASLIATAFQFSGEKKWLQFQLMMGYRNRFLKLIYTQPFNNPTKDIPEGQEKLRDLIVAWLDKNDENRDAFWQ